MALEVHDWEVLLTVIAITVKQKEYQGTYDRDH